MSSTFDINALVAKLCSVYCLPGFDSRNAAAVALALLRSNQWPIANESAFRAVKINPETGKVAEFRKPEDTPKDATRVDIAGFNKLRKSVEEEGRLLQWSDLTVEHSGMVIFIIIKNLAVQSCLWKIATSAGLTTPREMLQLFSKMEDWDKAYWAHNAWRLANPNSVKDDKLCCMIDNHPDVVQNTVLYRTVFASIYADDKSADEAVIAARAGLKYDNAAFDDFVVILSNMDDTTTKTSEL